MKENLKCSFIVPGYKCDQYIFRNIESILDQDYKNYEIIVVLNGEWETKSELASGIKNKYSDKVKLYELHWGNLANANNFGFEKSSGDIISHLSSDLFLCPGTLRTWVEAFNENPNCDLVYSGYRFVSNNPTDIYYSNSFDRYHLECENFIDGANPYRRRAFVRWDTELKSLIDWDWALSITSSGKPAYYIKEPLYWAELPKAGGLSEDSNKNWIVRRRQIRTKHGIPDRKICISSLNPSSALELAKICDFDFRIYPGHKPHDYSVVYAYGFPCSLDTIQISTGLFFGHYGQKIIHWMSSDLRTLIQLRWLDVDYFTQNVLKKIQNHFCLNIDDQKLLEKIGINAEILYPPVLIPQIEKKIDAISVNDEGLLYQLQKAMPDQEFRKDDLSCKITVHFEDNISNIIKSICLGNIVISNIQLPNNFRIMGFTNVPELRKMLVHTIRGIKKNKIEPEEKIINEFKQKIKVSYFKNKILKIAERNIPRYGKLESELKLWN